MNEEKSLTESLEKYLKAAYCIVSENQAARVKDVSNFLNIGASSVSEALHSLAERGFINYQPYGLVTMTPKGEKYAQDITKRHEIICNFLENVLLVDKGIVDENAEKLEFGISEEVLTKFVSFLEFMQTCSCKEPKWIKSYKHYATQGDLQSKCKECVKKYACSPDGHSNQNCCGGGN